MRNFSSKFQRNTQVTCQYAVWLLCVSLSQAQSHDSSVQSLEQQSGALWAQFYEAERIGNESKATQIAETNLVILKQLYGKVRNYKPNVQLRWDVITGQYNALTWLSSTYAKQNNWQKAIEMQQKLASLMAEVYGESNPSTIDARLRLGDLKILRHLPNKKLMQFRLAEQRMSNFIESWNKGDAEKAHDHADLIFPVFLEVLGEDNHRTINIASDLGQLKAELGKSTEADKLLRSNLAAARRLHQHTHPQLLRSIARLASTTPDIDESISLRREWLDLAIPSLGEEHEEIAAELNGLAATYMYAEHLDKAKPLLKRSLNILRKLEQATPNPPVPEATGISQSLGDESKKIARRHPLTSEVLRNLGALYLAEGDIGEALPFASESYEIRSKEHGIQDLSTCSSSLILAMCHLNMGNYGDAEKLLLPCIDHLEKLDPTDVKLLADTLSALGEIYLTVNDLERARPLLVRSLTLCEEHLPETDPEFIRRLNDLAVFSSREEDWITAIRMSKRVVAAYKKALGEKHRATATAKFNLAVAYSESGNVEEAIPLMESSLATDIELLGKGHPDTISTALNLAGLHLMQGECSRADALLTDYMERANDIIDEKSLLWSESFFVWSIACEALGKHAEALSHSREALKAYENHYQESGVFLAEDKLLLKSQGNLYFLDLYLTLARDHPTEVIACYEGILGMKGSLLAQQRAIRALGSDPTISETLNELKELSRKLLTLSDQSPSVLEKSDWVAWKKQLSELKRRKGHLEGRLNRESQVFHATREEITVNDLQRALPADAVLIDFLQYNKTTVGNLNLNSVPTDWVSVEPSLTAFVLRRGKPIQRIEFGPLDSILEDIDMWVGNYGSSSQAMVAGRRLREKLLDPLLEFLRDSRTILISTDGELGKIPFGALPAGEERGFLIEHHRIGYLAMAQLIPDLIKQKEQIQSERKQDLLLVGGVDYDASNPLDESAETLASSDIHTNRRSLSYLPSEPFGILPETLEEVAEIETLYTSSTAKNYGRVIKLTDDQATKQQFIEKAPSCRHLHLATHGYYVAVKRESLWSNFVSQVISGFYGISEDDALVSVFDVGLGLDSGIVFAGANQPDRGTRSAGLLTAQEISFLPLENVDLVVLSACETGLGEVTGGQGLIGIQRAFQVAGAKSTVASLWQVHDHATSALMHQFYKNLWMQKMSRLDALREAQLWMIKNYEPTEGPRRGLKRLAGPDSNNGLSPYYWAAFVLCGDWR